MILNQLFENQPAPSGSAYDRGGADAWYHRGRHPHKIVDGREVALTDPEEIADYNRGYDDEGIEGRHQGKQYDVREETSDSCDAFRHNLRQQVQQRAAGDQADLAIAQARDPGQWQWQAGDQVLSKKTGKTYSIIGPALDRKLGAMYLYQRGQKGSPDWEQGRFIAHKAHQTLVKINESDVREQAVGEADNGPQTPIEKARARGWFDAMELRFRDPFGTSKPELSAAYIKGYKAARHKQQRLKFDRIAPLPESDVTEAKPVAQTIDHAVWSKKSPDDQRFLKQLHPKLKITNVPPPPRAEKPPKVKPDLWKIALKAEDVWGNIFPDGDPVDYMYPYLKSLGIPIEKQFDVLNKAIKLHVDKKGYYHWLEASWDNVAKDRQMPDIVRLDNNPWRTNESVAEAGPFSYGVKKPRRGTVAHTLAQRSRAQDLKHTAIEPRDQQVGVAKIITGHDLCPACSGADIKTYSDGEKECNQCHQTWDVKGMAEGSDILKVGTSVRVPHKGKMVPGKIVRYDSGKGGYSPAYVVDIGEYESKIVPVHNVKQGVAEGANEPKDPVEQVGAYWYNWAHGTGPWRSESDARTKSKPHKPEDSYDPDDRAGVQLEGVVMTPAVAIPHRKSEPISPKQQKTNDREVKLLKKYREKGLDISAGLKRLGKFKSKHGLEEQGVMENAEELNVGDPVIITGNVKFQGKTGDIDSFGQDKRFVIVNLYNHGKHSFHSSDVSRNEYADSEEEHDEWTDIKEASDISGLLAASQLNKQFRIRAAATDNGKPFSKSYRVKAQSARVAKEKLMRYLTTGDRVLSDVELGDAVEITSGKIKEAGETRHVLYLNGKAAAHYPTKEEAQQQAALVKAKVPNTQVDIRSAQAGLAEERVRLDARCWRNKKIGNPKTKLKGGVRVNNCVPK